MARGGSYKKRPNTDETTRAGSLQRYCHPSRSPHLTSLNFKITIVLVQPITMKLLHHLTILILPLVVLAKPGSARVEPRRVAHLAIRDGLVSRGHALELRHDAHTGTREKQVHRVQAVDNILEPRTGAAEVQLEADIQKWLQKSSALQQRADILRREDQVILDLIQSVNKKKSEGKGSKDPAVVQGTADARKRMDARIPRKLALRADVSAILREEDQLFHREFITLSQATTVTQERTRLTQIYNYCCELA
jgi:hypothetical protein